LLNTLGRYNAERSREREAGRQKQGKRGIDGRKISNKTYELGMEQELL
jgi:hypothetical protein